MEEEQEKNRDMDEYMGGIYRDHDVAYEKKKRDAIKRNYALANSCN